MPRNIFDLSRFRGRQSRPPHLHRVGHTGTETTGSHELHSMSQSHASHQSDQMSVRSFIDKGDVGTMPAKNLEVNILKSSSKIMRGSTPIRHVPSMVAHSASNVSSQRAVVELQSSVDFLNTKLQQSESHVKALQAQNSKLRSLFEKILKHQHDRANAKAIANTDRDNDVAGKLLEKLDLLDQDESSEDEDSRDENTPFLTCQDAIQTLSVQYQQQVEALLTERGAMQRKVQQLTAHNEVQAETMASLEEQLCRDRQKHRKHFDEKSLCVSTSIVSKASSRRLVSACKQPIDRVHSAQHHERRHKGTTAHCSSAPKRTAATFNWTSTPSARGLRNSGNESQFVESEFPRTPFKQSSGSQGANKKIML